MKKPIDIKESITDTLTKFGFVNSDGTLNMEKVNELRKSCKNCGGTGIVKNEMAGKGCVTDCLWCTPIKFPYPLPAKKDGYIDLTKYDVCNHEDDQLPNLYLKALNENLMKFYTGNKEGKGSGYPIRAIREYVKIQIELDRKIIKESISKLYESEYFLNNLDELFSADIKYL